MEEKTKSAVESFLEGTSNENMFEKPSNDPFAAVEAKGEVTEEAEEKEKPLPFHKDPKVQKFIDKEIEKRLKDIKPSETKTESKQENDEVVESLIAVIGNDTPEKRRAVEALRDRLDQGAKEIAAFREEQKANELADKQAEEKLTNAFENIEDAYDVDLTSAQAKKTREEFITFIEKIAPKRNGEIVEYPDMNSAWETFREIKKSTPSRAKELASRSMARSAETSVKQEKKIDWNAVDEMMDTLK